MNTASAQTLISSERPFVVRDPVHGYLIVAAHERLIIDHPVTQRLRRITQTGLAEYVFPEARTSRFIHSLGAMHLASRFVLAALENADAEVAGEFFRDIDSRLGRYDGARERLFDLLQQDGAVSALLTVRASFNSALLRDNEIKPLMAVAEAALRLAALFHDLGHLPFSHDGEYALQDYAKESLPQLSESLKAIAAEDAPHEEIGHRLAQLVFRSLAQDTSPAVKAAFELATAILNAKTPQYGERSKPHASPLQWLHSLVDGEIDVDRADYLLRDGQALGLDFAHYDVDRLVNNLVLIKHEELGFVTAVKEKGLPSLESYCLSRSRSNQVFVRHHKVSQAAAALRHASTVALGSQLAKPLLDVLTALGQPNIGAVGTDLLDQFAPFDDTWWIQMLRQLQKQSNDTLTKAALDLVLDRRRTFDSLWKRKGDLSEEQFTRLNEVVDDFFVKDGSLGLSEKRRALKEKGVLILAFKFRPFVRRAGRSGPSVMLIQEKQRHEPASERSPLISGLQSLWDKDVHLYAFTERSRPLSLAETVDIITGV